MSRFLTLDTRSSNFSPVLPRLALLLVMPFALAGCFNSSDAAMTLDLGSVSVGQQLMDLDKAQSAGAITKAEHRMIRDKIISGIAALEIDEDDIEDSVSIMLDVDEDGEDRRRAKEEEDGFNWF